MAYGTFPAVHDPDAMFEMVSQYVDFLGSSLPRPWKFDAASDYSRKMIGAIVGFRIEIGRLEGKWKLNQNHPRERREKVVEALSASADELSQAVADLMKSQLEEGSVE